MKYLFLLCVAIVICGCSTNAHFFIKSNPPGASVTAAPQKTINNVKPAELYLGTTPTESNFVFGKDGIRSYLLDFKMPGFQDQKVSISSDSLKQFMVKGRLTCSVDFDQAKLSILSDPPGAAVKVTPNKGSKKEIYLGLSPLVYVCDFGPDSPTQYTFSFSLPGYENAEAIIDYNSLDELLKKDEFVYSAKLEKQEVKEIEKLIIEVSESKGYSIKRTKARSWDKDIEREGMAPTRILLLKDNQSISGMTLIPDDTKLYFSLAEIVLDDRNNEKVVSNLRAITTSGGGIAQITSGQWIDSQPTCSSEGKFIIFSSNRLQHDKSDLYRITTENTGGISVVRQTPEGENYEASLSMQGAFAYTYMPRYLGQQALPQIWTMGGDYSYPTQLRNGSMPSLSPDGQEIAFIGDDKQLWKMSINGMGLIQLTDEPVFLNGKMHPTWSPDGKYILFASDVAKDDKNVANYDIWMIPANGGIQRQLTTNGSEDDYPVVSHNQDYIYFVSNRVFKYGIWRIPFPTVETKF